MTPSMPKDPQKSDEKRFIHIKIRRRAWYEWLVWIMWLFLLFLFIKFAIASGQEREVQASRLSWVIFFFLLAGGLIVGYVRELEARERDERKYRDEQRVVIINRRKITTESEPDSNLDQAQESEYEKG
jgi:hypothetical protein